MLFQDTRDYQILFLSLFLVLGIGTRDWTLHPEFIGVTIATCLSTQWIFSVINKWREALQQEESGRDGEDREEFTLITSSTPCLCVPAFPRPRVLPLPMSSFRSPLITSLGLSLLLRADHWTTMAFAAVVAIASKFVFKIDDKHFFNPANFGIISALVLTSDAWVSPGQWGEEWWYGLLFVGTGGMVLKRIGRWDTTAAFLGVYAGLEASRNLWLGWTWDVYWHRLMSGSLLVFALFMVTDPRSIPNSRIGRVIWAVAIATLTFILRNYFFLSTAVFWALFILAPFTILLDVIWQAPRFGWEVGEGGEVGERETKEVINHQLITTNHCTGGF
ncbi:RnfABCDGE type electron transport complex subunit D [Chlorogloeopsis sp. ULAP01]|uniref:RnfABCDGE type electron transport complex subunit D n=1 Tax=Chlorogloeopsis sp. ULAP01 TaxID=3056483 RepID=UPI0025AB3B0D|nr:RnfABCDGE type electron transport complex subunit D [Chlorogloeopsis sp. ULAP01]MDM9379887.1 RnfABCDGE type electron transport complex subunit D [Chlorogloeopsis sp. ULAP01]